MTLFFNLLVLLIFVVYTIRLINKDFKFSFLYGILIIQGISIIPSLIYIEEGIYISEQGRDSFFVGATATYVLYFIVTMLFLKATFQTLKNFKPVVPKFVRNSKSIESSVVIGIVVLVMGILFFNASQSALPFFDTTVTRFDYWPNSKFPFLNKIFGNTAIFIPFSLGILFRKYRKFSLLMMLVYFGYNFLIGQKFSPIVSGTFSFLLPIVYTYKGSLSLKSVIKLKFIIPFIVISCVVYQVIYKKYDQRKPYAIIKIYDPDEAMFYRAFGLQGHLLWGAVETYSYNSDNRSYNPLDFMYGMHRLMDKFAANTRGLKGAQEKGFNFTNGYPSILFMTFPMWLAFVLHIIFTISILAVIGWLLKYFLLQKAYVMSIISYQLFNWTIYAFTMGYFYKLTYTIAFFILYFTYAYIYQRNRLKENQ